jgi:hypothetical protein
LTLSPVDFSRRTAAAAASASSAKSTTTSGEHRILVEVDRQIASAEAIRNWALAIRIRKVRAQN